ncbi:MAG: CPBP family intramembrane metalloprotease [Candidatus Korarchaeota archaeon]|nr:CPBP family intramembrane metalloprotease [Candidatus Korarchaeota archaeon]NIU84841.1 CPBP family intramembrane metalloprotease [Candidatus Thorarchaeota archaeon]NIW14859.1 CPBP family intramembrane metalloprotease [Candidatus Thorarchaeota archaeon]NIW52900.1 CPBP family intramembrane metalloprotease [Candidatus Korarchaeota archaeon]
MNSDVWQPILGLLSIFWWPLALIVMYLLKRWLPPSQDRSATIRGLGYVVIFWVGRTIGTLMGGLSSTTEGAGGGMQELGILLLTLPIALLWVFFAFRKIEGATWRGLGWNVSHVKREVGWGILLGLGLFLLLEFNLVFTQLPLFDATAVSIFALFLMSFGVASWQEENLYRGFLQPKLETQIGDRGAIVTQAVLFSVAHIGYWSFTTLMVFLLNLLLVGVMGVILGYYRQRYTSVIAPFLAHGLVDFLPVFW